MYTWTWRLLTVLTPVAIMGCPPPIATLAGCAYQCRKRVICWQRVWPPRSSNTESKKHRRHQAMTQNLSTVATHNATAMPEAAQSPLLLVDRQDGLVTLTLNRPNQYNALSTELLDALHDTLTTLDQDLDVRCVVIAGAGRAFCAGHDLKQMRANPDRAYYLDLFTRCGRVMQDIVNLPVPVIAKVHGTATAAGCQLVASCDLAIAADTARFAVSGINVGLFCSTPAVALTRTMPIKKAFEMLVTGKFIDAHEAAAQGLINRAVPADQLDAELQALVDVIASKSSVAVRTGKAMYRRQAAMSLSDAYMYAGDIMAGNMMSDDACEGIDAFIEKRAPVWKGR